MRKLVVPVDFSQDSVVALNKAIYMAGKMDGEIDLIHVNKLRTFASLFGASHTMEDEEEIEKNFAELIANVDAKGIKINHYLRTGNVSTEIVKFAEKHEAYMIIMGTHGISGFEQFWAGSNAYKVITNAECPVLTVRGDTTIMDIKTIILPVDTTISTRQKVPFTAELARIFDAKITVLSVCLDESEEFIIKLNNYGAQVCRFLNEQGVENDYEFVSGSNVTDMTLEYARKVGADMISIMTEQETSVMNNFLGPYAQQMVNHSRIPVLSMHKNPNLEGSVHIM